LSSPSEGEAKALLRVAEVSSRSKSRSAAKFSLSLDDKRDGDSVSFIATTLKGRRLVREKEGRGVKELEGIGLSLVSVHRACGVGS
jgi:hypothetical protein